MRKFPRTDEEIVKWLKRKLEQASRKQTAVTGDIVNALESHTEYSFLLEQKVRYDAEIETLATILNVIGKATTVRSALNGALIGLLVQVKQQSSNATTDPVQHAIIQYRNKIRLEVAVDLADRLHVSWQ